MILLFQEEYCTIKHVIIISLNEIKLNVAQNLDCIPN